MYNLSHDYEKVNLYRPRENLLSNKKVKFEKGKQHQFELYLRSPLCRGISTWEMLTADVQRVTTKVTFKKLIHVLCVLYVDGNPQLLINNI